jgi:hypothetical protein
VARAPGEATRVGAQVGPGLAGEGQDEGAQLRLLVVGQPVDLLDVALGDCRIGAVAEAANRVHRDPSDLVAVEACIALAEALARDAENVGDIHGRLARATDPLEHLRARPAQASVGQSAAREASDVAREALGRIVLSGNVEGDEDGARLRLGLGHEDQRGGLAGASGGAEQDILAGRGGVERDLLLGGGLECVQRHRSKVQHSARMSRSNLGCYKWVG